MGEGLAIGFDAIGARVDGERAWPACSARSTITGSTIAGLVLKLPTERLSHIDGTPREDFEPRPGR